MAVFFMAAASAQTRTVRGSVVDENDTPVIGATVIVKDSPTPVSYTHLTLPTN